MIDVAPDDGSRELLKPMIELGLPARHHRLKYGDVRFMGFGLGGEPLIVGVEVKTIRDMVDSIQTKRFAGRQMKGMLSPEHYDRAWLLLIGHYRKGQNGVLEHVVRGRWVSLEFPYRRFRKHLLTFTECGMRIIRAADLDDAAREIELLYDWYHSTHTSHLAVAKIERPPAGVALPLHESPVRVTCDRWPGIGWHRGSEVEKKFATVVEMVNAPANVWQEIPGFGAGLSQRIYDWLRGRG